ncbi:hypothetical protein TNIN_131281 [Trichonephila inaurata madagascariensis]|uniref:F-box domain-containing protein n=1 Tax=Trichonephila inaurata madagascariensis TaxID=2747483 RepID=A0A8X6MGM9_9ARAC|nr:hypothetical protein TNIN_131281 [Trichonephila inaurata madagascariensis]
MRWHPNQKPLMLDCPFAGALRCPFRYASPGRPSRRAMAFFPDKAAARNVSDDDLLLRQMTSLGCPPEDLGYHTLPPDDESTWGKTEPPTAPLLSPVATQDTDKLVATFKGKKLPKRPCPFDKLPDNLIVKIFSYLSSNELCVSARVCRRWYFLVWEPQLWTSVTLSGERIQVDRGLKTLFRLLCRDSPTLCLTVERIHLSGCSKLTDKGLATIALKCPELKVLELRGCSWISSRGVTDIVSRCHSLEKLDLTGE